MTFRVLLFFILTKISVSAASDIVCNQVYGKYDAYQFSKRTTLWAPSRVVDTLNSNLIARVSENKISSEVSRSLIKNGWVEIGRQEAEYLPRIRMESVEKNEGVYELKIIMVSTPKATYGNASDSVDFLFASTLAGIFRWVEYKQSHREMNELNIIADSVKLTNHSLVSMLKDFGFEITDPSVPFKPHLDIAPSWSLPLKLEYHSLWQIKDHKGRGNQEKRD